MTLFISANFRDIHYNANLIVIIINIHHSSLSITGGFVILTNFVFTIISLNYDHSERTLPVKCQMTTEDASTCANTIVFCT